jgi:protocatechuate 3,4-dioxygenase beta subunit
LKKPKIIAALLVAMVALATFLWLWSSDSADTTEPASDTNEEQTAPETPFISGRVVDSTGSPISGATVDTADGDSATTGDDGRFRLDELEAGTHRLDARAEGFVVAGPEVVRRVDVVLSDEPEINQNKTNKTSGVSDLELVLRRPASVKGRVVASGRPVSGASIGIYYLSVDGLSGRLDPFVSDGVTTTSDKGEFVLEEVVPARLALLVEAKDYAVAESREFMLEPGETQGDILIDLDPSATVFGEVVDTQGAPIQAQLVLRGASLARSRKVEASHDGKFVFRDVPAGTFVLEANAAGYRTERVESVEAVVGETNAQDVVMESASGIYGRVVDPDGEPVASSFVQLRPPKGRWKFLRTDADGRFQWDEPTHQRFTATAVAQHFESSRPVGVSVGQESTLELRNGGSVSGRVVGPDGRPVQSFSIGVESIEVDGPRPYQPSTAGLKEINDSAGRFAFESLRPGTYWFRAQTARFASASSASVVVRAGRESSGVTIRVGQAGSVSGEITNSNTGRPVAGASVTIFDPTSPFETNQTRTDSSGRYALDGVAPGRRSLRVSKKGYLSTVSGGVQITPGRDTTRNVQIRQQKPGERMQFQGIGAVLRKTDDGIQILDAMEGHAASEFGLKRNDIIRSVDRESVEGLRLDEVVEQIRGQQGVPVELEIERKGGGRFTVEIERGQVVVKE